ncbi:MAG: hypothetical protein DSM107014_03105 [Gomphosphaeria aponina SAG 52.96 = DSM 107014]|uniref:Uncharacterized protein n=1 Tax=Gomphosphaeria aponina SAG 52.96 = DSM 107014 TaxID=1521640 RepID=A0A941JRG5_9CHRO|nr:hypothetical protein [Gomphosphaeria aponina SAG 52.96 = DSM 107014]
MTKNNCIQEKINRLNELAAISRQRYLENGGNPQLSVGTLNNNDCLNEWEKEELRNLFKQVVTDENIANYQKINVSWQGKFAAK